MARLAPALVLLAAFWAAQTLVAKEMVYYLDFQRINVTYWNPNYYKWLNVTNRRYGRRDPIHYVHLQGETAVPFGNNITVDVFVYEFLSNEYRPSFVEMHYKMCDFILKDKIFMPFLRKVFPVTCPYPPGVYNFVNISFPDLPLLRTFPFQKGRVFVHIAAGAARERVADAYFDMEVKQRWR